MSDIELKDGEIRFTHGWVAMKNGNLIGDYIILSEWPMESDMLNKVTEILRIQAERSLKT